MEVNMESTKKVSSKQAALDMDARNKARVSSKKEGGILKRARWGATHRIHDHFVDGFPLLSDRFVREREAAERRYEYNLGSRHFASKADGEAGIGALKALFRRLDRAIGLLAFLAHRAAARLVARPRHALSSQRSAVAPHVVNNKRTQLMHA